MNLFEKISGKYPIGLWWPPPAAEMTLERYQEIAYCGINFIVGRGGAEVLSKEENIKALQYCEQTDMKLLVADERLNNIDVFDPAAMQAVIDDYSSYPGLLGYCLKDEPNANQYSVLSSYVEYIKQHDPGRLGYLNAFPSYARTNEFGTRNIYGYMERFMNEIKPDVLSYDHYPLLDPGFETPEPHGPNNTTIDFFANMELNRALAAKHGVPLWNFIQSVGYRSRRTPTPLELAWQVNTFLAYGFKGLLYFTYWTPVSHEAFSKALITTDGVKTDLYDVATQLNEKIQRVGRILSDLTCVGTHHFGSDIPLGSFRFMLNPYVQEASGEEGLLSYFTDGEAKYIALMNKSLSTAHEYRLRFPTGTASKVVAVLEAGLGKSEVPTCAAGSVDLYLGAGTLVVLRLNRD